jgi:hypothetical protein
MDAFRSTIEMVTRVDGETAQADDSGIPTPEGPATSGPSDIDSCRGSPDHHAICAPPIPLEECSPVGVSRPRVGAVGNVHADLSAWREVVDRPPVGGAARSGQVGSVGECPAETGNGDRQDRGLVDRLEL